jgi:hypothetical protein
VGTRDDNGCARYRPVANRPVYERLRWWCFDLTELSNERLACPGTGTAWLARDTTDDDETAEPERRGVDAR